MNKGAPLASVIVPTYCREERIEVLLNRLSSVALSDHIAVIIVDQSPQPLTLSQCGASTGRFLSFIILRQQKPNVAAARNAGVMRSGSDLLLFLDDDIELEHNFFPKLLNQFRESHHSVRGPQSVHPGIAMSDRNDDEIVSFLPTQALAVRRSTFLEVGGFDVNLRRFCEDAELCHRLKLAGHPIIKSHALVAIHHDVPIGGTHSSFSMFDRAWTRMEQYFYFHQKIGSSLLELAKECYGLIRAEYNRERSQGRLRRFVIVLLMIASVVPAYVKSFRRPQLLN